MGLSPRVRGSLISLRSLCVAILRTWVYPREYGAAQLAGEVYGQPSI